MSSQEPEPIYCQPQDVADLLNLEVTDTTKPSAIQIKKLINNKQDKIDRDTKHAWREIKADEEIHDLEGEWVLNRGFIIYLRHRKLKALDYSKGDRIQYWSSGAYQDILKSDNTMENGVRADLASGWVEFQSFAWAWSTQKRYRMVYRYGEDVVPKTIRECCAKMVACDIISGSMFWNTLPMGGDKFSINDTVRIWKEDIEAIISAYEEIVAIY